MAPTDLGRRFFDVFDDAVDGLRPSEVLLASFAGERSGFVRFSQGRVRQAGEVSRGDVTFDLVDGERHAQATATLGGDRASDREQLRGLLERLRDVLPWLAPDPYLNYSSAVHDTFEQHPAELPRAASVPDLVARAASGRDLVGVWAQGRIARGFANSLGQRNWYEADSFNVDASFHGSGGAAVKWSHAGSRFDERVFLGKAVAARAQLVPLERPAVEPAPGCYRAYFAPAALEEMLTLLGFDAFGLKSHRTRETPLLKMIADGRAMDPAVTLHEVSEGGPRFTAEGFLRPDVVRLIERGRYVDCLAAARSAKEYSLAVNAAEESPEGLDMAAGSLEPTRVLAALDTGLYLSNLWYTNYSDRTDCRITGMTRYACFWVENGELVAPLASMRFDDSLYRILGDGLVALTREREMIVDPDTYGGRSLRRAVLPGVLVDGLRLAL